MSNGPRSRVELFVHVVWATHRRMALLPREMDPWLAEQIGAHAGAHGCRVVACGNADDHVHVLLSPRSTTVLADVVQAIKGRPAHDWNASGRPLVLAWQEAYWAESLSPEAAPAVARYVRSQRRRHDGHPPPEPWERWSDDVPDR